MKKVKQILHKQKGFTLVEILVALAIFAMVLVGLFAMLTSMIRVRNNNNTDQQLNSEANHAMNRIEFLIRNGITMPDICTQGGCDACFRNGVCGDSCSSTNNSIATITETGAGGAHKSYWRNQIRGATGNIEVVSTRIGSSPPQTTTASLLAPTGVQMENLSFTCEVISPRRPNQTAILTVSFRLSLVRDTLRDFETVSEDFTRSITIANSHTFLPN